MKFQIADLGPLPGRWYRFHYSEWQIGPPDDRLPFALINLFPKNRDIIEGWEQVPLPSLLHSKLNYIYTIDFETGALIVSLWKTKNGSLTPATIHYDLFKALGDFALNRKSFLNQPSYMSDERFVRMV